MVRGRSLGLRGPGFSPEFQFYRLVQISERVAGSPYRGLLSEEAFSLAPNLLHILNSFIRSERLNAMLLSGPHFLLSIASSAEGIDYP